MHVKFFLIGAEAKKLQQTTMTEQKKRLKEDKSCWLQKQVDGELIIDCTCHRGDFKSTQIS